MPTLSEALRYYLAEDRRDLTNLQYSLVIGRLIEAIGPARDVRRVTYEDLVDYFEAQKARGLKSSSIASYTSMVKAFFNWCVRHGYAEQSPAQHLRRKVKTASRDPRSRAIPNEELRRMVDYARMTSKRNYALLMFLVDTGCRAGGAASLTRARLHLEGYALLDEKGGKPFKARFGVETADALRAWLAARPDADHDSVWTGLGPHYKALTPDGISAVVRVLAAKTGASRAWAAHAIRHAVGHAYAEAGLPPTAAQAKLGHSDVLITLNNYYPDGEEYADRVSRENPLIALKASAPEPPEPPRIVDFRRSG